MEPREELLKTELFISHLEENKRSVEALIALLECEGEIHPQYNQLDYLQKRIKEIDNQLIGLNKIKNLLLK